MRRWVFNLLSGLCLLLCVILLYSWLRSYLPRDWRMDSDQGRLLIVTWEGSLPRNGAWDDWDPSRLETFKGVPRLWNRMITISDGRWLGFQSTRGRLAPMQVHIIAIPFWFLFLPSAIPPVLWFVSLRRRRRRARSGHCVACGYDLRESKEKCPECGIPIQAPTT